MLQPLKWEGVLSQSKGESHNAELRTPSSATMTS
jgi:hypothetical protein